jgi:hypothetical protein
VPSGPRDGGWQVHDSAGKAGRTGEAGPGATRTVHEQGTSSLFAAVVESDRSAPAVRAAEDAVRSGAREVDRQVERWRSDPARAAALLVSKSVSAGYAATPGERPVLRVAVVLVLAGTVTVAATDESMGALLGTDGTVRRPLLDRPSGPGGVLTLHRTSCPEAEAATVVIGSALASSSRQVRGSDRLAELCRRLAGAPPDAARALANFRYDHYGATGTDAAVLALVHRSVARHSSVGRRGAAT